MNNKFLHLRSFLLGAGATLLVGSMAFSSEAATALKSITADLNYRVSVTMNGDKVSLLDANGNTVIPITYNGTTYLPVRALANLLDLQVNWDQASQTVALGHALDQVDLIKNFKAFYLTNEDFSKGSQQVDQKPTEISGISCTHWLQLKNGAMSSPGDKAKVSFNVQGKYETVSFKYYSNEDVVLRVLGDDDFVLAEYKVTGSNVAQEVTVNLQGSDQLAFEAEKASSINQSSDTRIFDAYLR